MKVIDKNYNKTFEDIKHIDENGNEYIRGEKTKINEKGKKNRK